MNSSYTSTTLQSSSKHTFQVPIPGPPSRIATANNSTTATTSSTAIKSDTNNHAIYYYRGESVNRSSIIVTDELVSPLDLTIIIFVLLLWATTILMCINKWGKIRMLEPYQPTFQAADEDDDFTNPKKPPTTVIRQPSSSCKSTLNRSTIRIIPSEVDLVNLHDSIAIGMSRAVDTSTVLGRGLGRGGIGGGGAGAGGVSVSVSSVGGVGGGGGSVTVGGGTSNLGSSAYGGKETRNIPIIEISPIYWSEERKCKSLEDVRVRLLS